MDQSLKVTDIKNELTDSTSRSQLKILPDTKTSIIKQKTDCFTKLEIYIKTEFHDDKNGSSVVPDTPCEIHPSDYLKVEMDEPMIKIEFDGQQSEIIKDSLDGSYKMKDEKQISYDPDGEPNNKMEPTQVEKAGNLLEPEEEDLHKSQTNSLDHFLLQKEPDNTDKKHFCSVCNKTFKYKCDLDRHFLIHSGITPYTCLVCKKSFNRKSNLDQHMLIHTGEKRHACSVCMKVFSHKSSLVSHQLIHSGIKPFLCIDCGKSFTNRHHLVIHKRIHTGEMPYECDLCHKAFKHKANLTEHRRIHTGDRPYTCDICKKTFIQKSALNSHKRTHRPSIIT